MTDPTLPAAPVDLLPLRMLNEYPRVRSAKCKPVPFIPPRAATW